MERIFSIAGYQIDWQLALIVASLILFRLMMITTTMPFLTGKPVPGMVKIGLALALMVFLYPALKPDSAKPIQIPPLLLIGLYLKEGLYGIAIGFASSIVFHGFQAAGLMVDNQRGAAQARLFNPQFGQETSIFGQFYYLFGIVLFLAIDGHLLFFRTIFQSYEYLPLLTFPASQPDLIGLVDEFIHLTGIVLLLSLQLCAPVVIAIFIADVILGTISRTAPAINVWELGFIVRGLIGVVIVFLMIGLVASEMNKMSTGMVGQVQRIIQFLSTQR